MSQLPNLFILGFPRCGTTSLFNWLCAHPEVHGSSPKETGFFVDRNSVLYDPSANYQTQGIEYYQNFFKHEAQQKPKVVLEATALYVYQQLALELLPDFESRPHFIFLVRKPSDQIFSTYAYLQNNWASLKQDLSFDEFIEMAESNNPRGRENDMLSNALHTPRYVTFLEKWVSRCGPERVHVLVLENLISNPWSHLESLSRTFGIDPLFYDKYEFQPENRSYKVRSYYLHQMIVKARPLFPDNLLRKGAQRLYRRWNTSQNMAQLKESNKNLLRQLDQVYFRSNKRLAEQFGLDLSCWDS